MYNFFQFLLNFRHFTVPSHYLHKILLLENFLNNAVLQFLVNITRTYLIIIEFLSRKS